MIFQNIVNESKLAEDTESDAEEDAHLDVEEPASKDGNNKEILAKSDAAGKSMVPTVAAAITQMASRTSPEKLTPSKVPNRTKDLDFEEPASKGTGTVNTGTCS